ncbi:hypothetical protein ECSTECEH250_1304 [Escherichia coli STEC_EH250]|nr:hypothetical protein ECSTECEH250_1304 [Escherichia coli STEC_EH250]
MWTGNTTMVAGWSAISSICPFLESDICFLSLFSSFANILSN